MAAHRYWRVYITAGGSNDTNCAELQMRTSAGGSNVATGGTALKDSELSNTTYAATNAFDGNVATFWNSAAGYPHYIGYDFGAGNDKDIVEIAYTVRNDGFVGNQPSKMFTQYSDNGANWFSVWAIRTQSGWTSGEQRVFSAANGYQMPALPGAHRYWRVNITAETGWPAAHGGQSYAPIREIQFRITQGGATVTTGGTAIADNGTASNAFDGNTGTYWSTSGGPAPHYIGYDFGAGNDKQIVEVGIVPYSTSSSQNPNAFTVDYSDNGTTWTTFFRVGGQASWDGAIYNPYSYDLYPDQSGVSARGWRVRTTATSSGDVFGLTTLEMRTAAGGVQQCSGGDAFSSSSIEGHDYDAYDTNLGSYWAAQSAVDWIGYGFASAKSIVEIAITARSTYTGQAPKDFTIEYWGGSSWIVAQTITGQTGWTDLETRVFTVSSPPVLSGRTSDMFAFF